MTEKKSTDTLCTKDNLCTLLKEDKKFSDKVEEAWFWYMFDFRVWRNEVGRIRKDYNGFGMELPNLCVELDDLFENFIGVEVKKTKNKKYQQFLIQLLDTQKYVEK